ASIPPLMFDWVSSPEIWISLLTLTFLEIILGIDNIVFISILAGKLPAEQQGKARQLGLSLALITRVLLLCSLAWMVKAKDPLFTVTWFGLNHGVSPRDLILLLGGLFLLYKSTKEIHEKLEVVDGVKTRHMTASFASVLVQIMLLDIVFSLDSVITAVGMAMVFMLAFSGHISRFIDKHPTLKMLALSFLLLIGFVLLVEGLHGHVGKGYIYFAMAFSVGVECLNIKFRAKQAAKVELHQPYR